MDLLGLKRTKQESAGLIMSSVDRITHVVETDRQGKKVQNHDLMTDCEMMGWVWR